MTSDRSELILSNARLILPEEVIESGWLVALDGTIVAFGEGRAP